MAFGSRGFKDFGLSGNLTLPVIMEDQPYDPGHQSGFMPEERKGKRKKHARFAIEDQEAAEVS